MTRFLASLVFGLLATTALAASSSLQMVGEARLNVMFFSVYDSRLYTEDGRYQQDQRPLRLEIEYLRKIKAKALVEQTDAEWDHLQVAHERRDAWLKELTALWPDVGKNDVIALELDADNRSTFYFNGEKLGMMEDADFGAYFVAIWLSPDTSRPALRAALLGGL
ncbi:chalcone isomerase family protein [Haliea sp. E1-2-M8]|uniref:chalcone isomerase family protein n=1 Tax=Haliea sp. E1-2-M8 TaxID=3064706 RepID=UPI00271F12FF|nr:chalcone isomerase family protein [Haliea sp. E1-2-M8]MDO8860333.1 chalcone isomerase family protein [Haliea sp. E1-2-M8]